MNFALPSAHDSQFSLPYFPRNRSGDPSSRAKSNIDLRNDKIRTARRLSDFHPDVFNYIEFQLKRFNSSVTNTSLATRRIVRRNLSAPCFFSLVFSLALAVAFLTTRPLLQRRMMFSFYKRIIEPNGTNPNIRLPV